MAESKSGSTVAPKDSRSQAKATREGEEGREGPQEGEQRPADMGRMRQIKRAYQVTHEHDRALPYLLLAAFLLPLAAAVTIGLLTDQVLNLIFVGLGVAVLLPMIVLVRRAKAAPTSGTPARPARPRWPCPCCPRSGSPPGHRGQQEPGRGAPPLGPGGLVLIGEGEPGRVKALLASEVRKHERVAYGVPVTTVVMGSKSGQVPLDKLADHIRKLPKTLQPNQITDIKQRLRALDAVRPSVPVPKGPMPTNPRQVKGARQAMRGR